MLRGTMTLRKASVLFAGLPPESTTMSILAPQMTGGGGLERQWSTEQHMLATIIDAVGSLEHTVAQVNSSKRLPKFKPLPRPGERTRSHRLTDEEKAALTAREES